MRVTARKHTSRNPYIVDFAINTAIFNRFLIFLLKKPYTLSFHNNNNNNNNNEIVYIIQFNSIIIVMS
jgi:hypothetical protein